jgi:dTDP-L-rhamnose 4-epimerase
MPKETLYNMYSKILVTGGAGFIGANLCIALLEKGYQVTVLDNLSKQIHGNNPFEESALYNLIKGKVNFIHGDVTNELDWNKAILDNEVIVHLAAETGTGQSMYQIKKYIDVNIGGTSILLDILANTKHFVRKVVIASSRAIYGEGKYLSKTLGVVYPLSRLNENLALGKFEVNYENVDEELTLLATDENSKIHPTSVYGITKQNQEQMVMTVCPTLNIPAVAFRYQNVYGPGQSLQNPYTGIISIFSTQIKNNSPLNVFEDGKESRDFVFIDDVIEATIAGIENDKANNQVFNVGTGEATTVLEVANALVESYKSEVNIIITGNYRLGDIRHNFADISKIKQLLDFTPSTNFKTGIKKFANWVETQAIKKSNYEQSIIEMKEKGLLK